MSHSQVPDAARLLDRSSIVDFVLLFALANVAVSFAEQVFSYEGSMPFGLRIAMTIAVTIAIHRLGMLRTDRRANTATGFPDPVVHDLQTGVLNRSSFFSRLDAALRNQANGFLMLVHANDIDVIDNRNGHAVGDFFLASLVARFDPTISSGDLVGRLDRETYCLFLRDRTQDEVGLIGRRMCGATLLPLGDSAERAQLSACVGYTEIATGEPVLDALERANSALGTAQTDGNSRVRIYQKPAQSNA